MKRKNYMNQINKTKTLRLYSLFIFCLCYSCYSVKEYGLKEVKVNFPFQSHLDTIVNVYFSKSDDSISRYNIHLYNNTKNDVFLTEFKTHFNNIKINGLKLKNHEDIFLIKRRSKNLIQFEHISSQLDSLLFKNHFRASVNIVDDMKKKLHQISFTFYNPTVLLDRKSFLSNDTLILNRSSHFKSKSSFKLYIKNNGIDEKLTVKSLTDSDFLITCSSWGSVYKPLFIDLIDFESGFYIIYYQVTEEMILKKVLKINP